MYLLGRKRSELTFQSPIGDIEADEFRLDGQVRCWHVVVIDIAVQ